MTTVTTNLPRAFFKGQDVSRVTRGPMTELVSAWLRARVDVKREIAKEYIANRFAHCGGGFA